MKLAFADCSFVLVSGKLLRGGGSDMPSRSRLTLHCAATLAMLGLASSALAQAGPAAGSAGAPAAPQPSGAESETAPPAPGERQRTVPSGCPFRDGKLELIV